MNRESTSSTMTIERSVTPPPILNTTGSPNANSNRINIIPEIITTFSIDSNSTANNPHNLPLDNVTDTITGNMFKGKETMLIPSSEVEEGGSFASSRRELSRGNSYTTLIVRPSLSYEKEDPMSDYFPPTIPEDSEEAIINTISAKSLKNFIPQLLLLLALFLSSFFVIALMITTLPGLFIPHSLTEIPTLATSLETYRSSTRLADIHIFIVLSSLFLWKQAFSIPGSVLTNILFGVLYGTFKGTLLACLFTAVGSTGSYFISILIAPLVEYYFSTALASTRKALNLPATSNSSTPSFTPTYSSSDIFQHLLLARFFPLIPYSVLNVISGVLKLPLPIFFSTLVIGSFPFNFVTVSIGSVITLASSNNSDSDVPIKIWSKEVLFKLIAVTVISVLPLLFKKRIQKFISSERMIVLIDNVVETWVKGKQRLGLSVSGNGSDRVENRGDRRRKSRSILG